MNYIKGPVISRRLGRSLGIDLLPANICSEDCLYCECGPTTTLTGERKEYVPAAEVIKELEQILARDPQADFITFSGHGEPTLHSKIGEIIAYLKNNYPHYRVAVLTNSTLLTENKVQQELKNIDLLVPSLDAGCEKTFQKICQPVKGITLDNIVGGIKGFQEIFQGKIWLEILFIKGLNDSKEEIIEFKKIVSKIAPDRVDLNTINRGPAYSGYKPVSEKKLTEIAAKFPEEIEVEIFP